jgi:hypothetical protein
VQFLRGCGWTPYVVEGHEPDLMHEAMATSLDTAVEQIKAIQQDARVNKGNTTRPRWPMIVLTSPRPRPKGARSNDHGHRLTTILSARRATSSPESARPDRCEDCLAATYLRDGWPQAEDADGNQVGWGYCPRVPARCCESPDNQGIGAAGFSISVMPGGGP